MARQAKLRQEDGSWASDAGGKTRYYGRVDEVPYKEALKRFREFLARPNKDAEVELDVNTLAAKFLGWVRTYRGHKANAERSRHINRFLGQYGFVSVSKIKASHLETFIEHLIGLGYALDYVHKNVFSIKAMFAKGVKKGWLSPSIRPFDAVDGIRKVPKTLIEASLPTDEEVKQLLEAADADTFGQMGDIVRLYHATGARTGELIAIKAGDFQRNNRLVVLAQHKRLHSMKQPIPRTIALNGIAFEILTRRTEGLALDDFVITRPINKTPYTSLLIGKRYDVIRRRAKVRGEITIYSLRHLWISEALMAGVDALLVARMAGTSVRMIETVYCHFMSQSLQEAQTKLDADRASRGV